MTVNGYRGIVMDAHTLLNTSIVACSTIGNDGCVVSREEYVTKYTCLIGPLRAHKNMCFLLGDHRFQSRGG
jgi:hypothetical protein